MGRQDDRDAVFAAAKELGWEVRAATGKSNYLKLVCGCGKHLTWLHASPSNPNYYREKIKNMRRSCPGT